VEDAVDQGKIDLTMMLRTQDYTQSIKRYEAVGPHYILIMALSNLQAGVECQDLVEVYKEYIARLVSTHPVLLYHTTLGVNIYAVKSFQVSKYPRRRLLRSLKYVEEELIAIYRIMTEQHNSYTYFGRVLNPESFRATTETKKTMYDLELALITKCCFKSRQRLATLEQLLRRVQRLTNDTKTSVEINDDDHGKAILVFTIVTLVFLPLSFVASFLGMNTADIRNQTANQTLY
jgi:Mg2+ and Co2+ transporter CorA